MEGAPRIPVTVLAGFLGSGKTTLVNRVLRAREVEPIAVIVNEFGEVGIDGRLVLTESEELVELANGCVCCTVRGDLQRTLVDLLERRRRRLFRRAPFERVLIEASGLASPGPIAQTLLADEALVGELELGAVTTLVSAPDFPSQAEAHPEALEQVGYADALVLNHLDRASDEQLARTRDRVRALNPAARLVECRFSEVDVDELLALRALEPGGWKLAAEDEAAHRHADGVRALGFETDRPLDLHRLKMWLRFLANRRGQDILRMKGILRCADHGAPVVAQAVYQWLQIGAGEGDPPATSRLVLIGRGLDEAELRRGFEACVAPSGG